MKSVFVVFALVMLQLATFGSADYLFAHCEKDSGDWAWIQDGWCKSWGAQDSACNGACLDSNRRYCLFEDSHKTQLCQFKEWCEKEGYKAKAKLCGYSASIPVHCSADREIRQYTFDNPAIKECTTIFTGENETP
ncbi:hypothetical protein BG015_001278 [Linnemannia schmuckeri]|uniref:Uncharacterized protein n=1 Tax=Linnemannia schmuckeri TaxID=64567 RepID=A0A9P5V6K5_9FUNG|nr:hypothetical protein BG015_001278 [Linnemannia schmuckeri]